MDPILIDAAIALTLAAAILLIERAAHRAEVRKANARRLQERLFHRRLMVAREMKRVGL